MIAPFAGRRLCGYFKQALAQQTAAPERSMELNPAHLHLMLNHIPVVGSMAVCALLLGALIFRSRSLVSAALAGMIAVALFSVPVFLSGEPAEEMVERSAHVSHDAIEEHEDIAKRAYWLALFGGLTALGLLLAGRGRAAYPVWVPGAAMLVSVITLGVMLLTASHGGRISHPEIRQDGLLPFAPAGSLSLESEDSGYREGEHDEEGAELPENDGGGKGRGRGRSGG